MLDDKKTAFVIPIESTLNYGKAGFVNATIDANDTY